MLGIIFTGGDGPDARVVKQLFDTGVDLKNTLFFAADSGLITAENAGIKPAWIIGDMDSLDDTLRLTAYPPERIIRLQHEKDYTDTEVALSLAIEKKCDQIWIIGGGGGRIDHLFGIRSLFERDIFPVRWITDTSDIYCINCNSALSELSLSRKKGTVVSVFPLGEGQWEAESIGLKWPLAGLPWNRGFFGLSNTTINESFFIKANKGRFMVILPGLV